MYILIVKQRKKKPLNTVCARIFCLALIEIQTIFHVKVSIAIFLKEQE